MTAPTTVTATARQSQPALNVTAAVVIAVAVNVLVYAGGRALGGSFRFTSGTGPAQVNAVTVAGFTAVPLLAGLTVAALAARRWPWLITVGLIAAPTLALSTIAIMTLPADLDPISTVTLALCHVVLVPVAVLALLRLRGRGERGTEPDSAP